MSRDAELVLLFSILHFIAIGFGVVLFVMFLRSEPVREWAPDDGGGDDGGSDREPDPEPGPHPSGDGLPLPDAVPARARLREPGRISEQLPRPQRRPAHPPERAPVREPAG